jgi:hypothetical protein
MSNEERLRLMEDHPIRTRDFYIPTPPLRRVFSMIVHLITSGAPGAAFQAHPRVGKTCATIYCARKLREIFPRVPVLLFTAHLDQRLTDVRLFRDLLEQSGYSPGNVRAYPHELRTRLVRGWFSLAVDHASHTLVLIIDEAQKLPVDGYSWLIDATNDLHKLGVRVVTLLFGQPDLWGLRETLRQMRRGDILGRFMARLDEFEGIGSAIELREVMECYDDAAQLAYPKGSDWSFSRFLLPEAYANGWRLSQHASQLWAEFERRRNTKLGTSAKQCPFRVGMEWITNALQYALVNSWDNDHPRLKLDQGVWSAAVDSTGFESSFDFTYEPRVPPEHPRVD